MFASLIGPTLPAESSWLLITLSGVRLCRCETHSPVIVAARYPASRCLPRGSCLDPVCRTSVEVSRQLGFSSLGLRLSLHLLVPLSLS